MAEFIGIPVPPRRHRCEPLGQEHPTNTQWSRLERCACGAARVYCWDPAFKRFEPRNPWHEKNARRNFPEVYTRPAWVGILKRVLRSRR